MNKAAVLVFIAGILIPGLTGQPGETDMQNLVRGNTAFSLDMYHLVRAGDGNIFFSPYSISTALAMTYAGARSTTSEEMAGTLHFSLDGNRLHAAFHELQTHLNTLQEKGPFRLNIANALWIQKDYMLLQEFNDLNRKFYGANLFHLNFSGDPEGSRIKINDWVEEKTEEKIKDLLPTGVIKKLTRLVLTNTIYFKAEWENKFDSDKTKEQDFWICGDNKTRVQMMNRKAVFGYWENEELQVLEMPYVYRGLSMIVFLPLTKDGLADLESNLTPETLHGWTSCLERRQVNVFLPKFKTTQDINLKDALRKLGMAEAFTTGADFSGMEPKKELYITDALHKAFIDVDEKGTEAAAATAVVMGIKAMMPDQVVPEFRADHPFLFLIKDNQSDSILFMGRLTQPGK